MSSNPSMALAAIAQDIHAQKRTASRDLILHLLESARFYIQESKTLDEVVRIGDALKIFEEYCRRYLRSTQDANSAAAMRIRAAAHAGRLMMDVPRENGKRTDLTSFTPGTKFQETLERIKVRPTTAYKWQKLAGIPTDELDLFLNELQQDVNAEVNLAAALEFWRKHYGPPPIVHEPVDGIPADAPAPPDDDEVDGEYEHANFGLNLQIAIQEFDQAFTEIMSLTAEKAVLELCQEQREKIAMLQAEMK